MLLFVRVSTQWFRDAFERMARDGRETQWRALCEGDQPESMPLPDPIDNSWTALRRLLVVRAVRSDRLLQLSKLFVAGVLGKRCAIFRVLLRIKGSYILLHSKNYYVKFLRIKLRYCYVT